MDSILDASTAALYIRLAILLSLDPLASMLIDAVILETTTRWVLDGIQSNVR